MIHTILSLALFGSVVWALVVLTILLVVFFAADIEENGYVATVFFCVACILFYLFGKETWHKFISILSYGNILFYLALGLVHAFMRVYFHGRNEMIKVNEDRLKGRSETFEHTIDKNIKGNVFRWWFLWPVSLINWFIKDMIKDIYNWIYKHMEKIFDYIMTLGIKSVKEVPKVPKPSELEKFLKK